MKISLDNKVLSENQISDLEGDDFNARISALFYVQHREGASVLELNLSKLVPVFYYVWIL